MIAIYKYDDIEKSGVVYSWDELHSATFAPLPHRLLVLNGARGKTYKDRKEWIEQQAIEYSNFPGISYSYYDYMNICNYFTTYGKRYGLLTDFHENGIC